MAAGTLLGVCFGTTVPIPAWVSQWEAEPLDLQEMDLPKPYPAHVCNCRRRHEEGEQESEQTFLDIYGITKYFVYYAAGISMLTDAFFIPYILASQFPPNSTCYCHVGRRRDFQSCKEAINTI